MNVVLMSAKSKKMRKILTKGVAVLYICSDFLYKLGEISART